MTRPLRAIALAVALLVAGTACAQTADETRYRQLAERIRCLVCQNQSLAESNAELATDLRRELREHIAAGRSDGEIIRFLVERYGDFVIYQPPFKASTALLWIGPFVLLGVAGAVLFVRIRRRRGAREDVELAEDERRLVEQVLSGRAEPGERP